MAFFEIEIRKSLYKHFFPDHTISETIQSHEKEVKDAMIRGINHQIIEVNETESHCFERALLFVRPQCAEMTESRLRGEAERFVSSLGTPPRPRHVRPMSRAERLRRRHMRRTVFALGWMGVGAALSALLFWLF